DDYEGRSRSDRVGPFHVERLLQSPARVGYASGLVRNDEVRGRKVERLAEGFEVGREGRVMVGLDECDCLPGSIALDGPGRGRKRDLIQPISVSDLGGRQAGEQAAVVELIQARVKGMAATRPHRLLTQDVHQSCRIPRFATSQSRTKLKSMGEVYTIRL